MILFHWRCLKTQSKVKSCLDKKTWTLKQGSLLKCVKSLKLYYNTPLNSLELQYFAVFIESSDDADVNEGFWF